MTNSNDPTDRPTNDHSGDRPTNGERLPWPYGEPRHHLAETHPESSSERTAEHPPVRDPLRSSDPAVRHSPQTRFGGPVAPPSGAAAPPTGAQWPAPVFPALSAPLPSLAALGSRLPVVGAAAALERRQALAQLLHDAQCDCGDRAEHEAEQDISFAELADAVMAAGWAVKTATAPVETKVRVGALWTLGASVAFGLLTWAQSAVPGLAGVPGWLPAVLAVLGPPVASFLSGYLAEHTPRPDDAPAESDVLV